MTLLQIKQKTSNPVEKGHIQKQLVHREVQMTSKAQRRPALKAIKKMQFLKIYFSIRSAKLLTTGSITVGEGSPPGGMHTTLSESSLAVCM
jgi:hypothetical protein